VESSIQQLMALEVPLFSPGFAPVISPSSSDAAASIAHHRQLFLSSFRSKSSAATSASAPPVARGVMRARGHRDTIDL
jgi:hypothetical protein